MRPAHSQSATQAPEREKFLEVKMGKGVQHCQPAREEAPSRNGHSKLQYATHVRIQQFQQPEHDTKQQKQADKTARIGLQLWHKEKI